jgi:hypothetical protein
MEHKENKEMKNTEEEDPLHITVPKFRKMIGYIKAVRDAQNKYFSTRTQESLVMSKDLEKRLDKALEFYIKNSDELHDLPF